MKKLTILTIVFGVVFMVGFAAADVSLKELIADKTAKELIADKTTKELIADKTATKIVDDMKKEAPEMGAIPGLEYFEKVHFNDGILPAGSYTFDMNFQAGTSTGQTSTEDTESYLGGVRNDSGGNLLCNSVYADIDTATGLFAYDIKVGEASSATSSATLISALDDGHSVGTTTTDVLNKQDDEGSNTDEVFIWEEGNYITATMVFNTSFTRPEKRP